MSGNLIQARLDGLIEAARCGQSGFSDAARHAGAPHFRTLFGRYAADCAVSGAELRTWIEISGTSDTMLRRPQETSPSWRDRAGLPSFDDDLGLLEMLHRGQEEVLSAYASALELPSLPELRYLLLRQQARVQRHCECLRAFRFGALHALG